MEIFLSIIASVLSGMGIGGGSIFILFVTLFGNVGQKEAQVLNLILFLVVGTTATIGNIKNKNIDWSVIKKTAVLLIFGSFVGSWLFYSINEKSLKRYFNYFLVIVGIYEIITSLIKFKSEKNMNDKKRKEK